MRRTHALTIFSRSPARSARWSRRLWTALPSSRRSRSRSSLRGSVSSCSLVATSLKHTAAYAGRWMRTIHHHHPSSIPPSSIIILHTLIVPCKSFNAFVVVAIVPRIASAAYHYQHLGYPTSSHVAANHTLRPHVIPYASCYTTLLSISNT